MDMLPNFTPRVQQAIKIAKNLCVQSRVKSVDPIHLIYGIFKVQDTLFFSMGGEAALSLKELKKAVLNFSPPTISKNERIDINYSRSFKILLRDSSKLAISYGHDYVGVEHVFLSLQSNPNVQNLFLNFDLDPDVIFQAVQTTLEGDVEEKRKDLKKFLNSVKENNLKAKVQKDHDPNPLEQFSINYTTLASQGKFDEVVSREDEINQVIEILCRRVKNNPIILGEAGVGKTALIEGLSQRIVSKQVPEILLNCEVFSLNFNSILAGTKYRGQFEERLKDILQQAESSEKNILFIDEVHTLMGAGNAEGGMDAANILKPLLARGDLKCIGATTLKEFKNSIEKDSALSRRFQSVLVSEPSKKDCLNILKSLAPEYEAFHQVIFRKNALEAAVELSSRYINDRFLPDKAIDIIDEAASKARVKNFHRPEEILNLESSLESLIDQEESTTDKERRKVLAECVDDLFEKYQTILDDWQKTISKKKIYISKENIEEVISQKVKIPLSIISSSSDDKYLKLESNLKKEIIGQDAAIQKICQSIHRSACGLNNPQKPAGVFLLLGRTGTGKTFMAKQVSKFIYGGEDKIIRIDMGEFSESSSSSKITGSSPGYVGYEDGSNLVDQVRKKPYSVILFDEIEKAHPDVLKSLLLILDEGKLSDNYGRSADFKNCLIILTGNLGSDILDKPSQSVGFLSNGVNQDIINEKINNLACKHFSPEFVNRISDIVIFSNFSDDHYTKIISIYMQTLNKRLKAKKILISISSNVLDFLVSKLKDLNLGARPIERLFNQHIESILCESILSKDIVNNDTVKFDYVNKKFTYSKSQTTQN